RDGPVLDDPAARRQMPPRVGVVETPQPEGPGEEDRERGRDVGGDAERTIQWCGSRPRWRRRGGDARPWSRHPAWLYRGLPAERDPPPVERTRSAPKFRRDGERAHSEEVGAREMVRELAIVAVGRVAL